MYHENSVWTWDGTYKHNCINVIRFCGFGLCYKLTFYTNLSTTYPRGRPKFIL